MKGKEWNVNQYHVRLLKNGKNLVFFIIQQILEKTEWRCKFQSKKLRKDLQENGTAHCERWIHVHLPSVDEHAVHPAGDVSFTSCDLTADPDTFSRRVLAFHFFNIIF